MIRARASLAAVGAVSAVAAVWFASSWLDSTNGDSTCGSLWQIGTWPHVRGCAGPMTVRLVIALALAVLALGAWWLSATKPPRRALFVSLAIVLIAVGALVVNENVRSDGLWAAGSARQSDGAAHPTGDRADIDRSSRVDVKARPNGSA